MLIIVLVIGEVDTFFTLQSTQASTASVILLLVPMINNYIATGAALAAYVAVHGATVAYKTAPDVFLFFLVVRE